MNNRSYLFAGALAAVLVATTISWFVFPPDLQRYVLAFPDTAGGRVHHETRYLPSRNSRLEAITLYAEELILGPSDVGAVPFLADGTRIRAVFLDRNGNLYLDLNSAVMFAPGGATAIEDVRTLLDGNLRFNFRFLRDVIVTIDGQVPGFPRIIAN